MNDRKERILGSALELFANQGYDSTATIRIAKHAEVSEGLIFKHFGNKRGLLDAILEEAQSRAEILLEPLMAEKSPQRLIEMAIEMPFGIEEAEHDFWRLQFKLKWEQEFYQGDKLHPLTERLEWAFDALGFDSPSQEAHLLTYLIDSISTEILRGNLQEQEKFKAFLLQKYRK